MIFVIFSYDFTLVFIAKALIISSVIFTPVRNIVVGVTKCGCSTVGEAGYRACSGRHLLVG